MPTLTITFTAAQATRVSAAYGEKLAPKGAPLSLTQVKAHLIDEIKQTVRAYETRQAHNAAIAAAPMPAPIDPT